MKNTRSISYIGEKYYQFDKNSEKPIYKYVCHKHLSRAERKKLSDDNMFETYGEWKSYVCKKYNDFTDEKLNEFSHFLNQTIRNAGSECAYWKLIIPVILTLWTDKLFKSLYSVVNIKVDSSVQFGV